jgi:peptidoglycan/xylan/chitin deacetylase (PgdA/CDA1 family)
MMRISVRAIAMLTGLALTGCAVEQSALSPAGQPLLAVTVDDLPTHSGMAPGETRATIARAIIAALAAERVPAMGFINGATIDKEPALETVLEAWTEAGLPLGNHSWSHADVDEVAADDYRQEVVRNEPLLERHSPDGDWRWFRYPYLREGSADTQRAAVRAILAERRYRIAGVTMDFSDWAFNDAYVRCAARGDTAAMAKLEKRFLKAARKSAKQSRTMARQLYGRDIPYVLLLHIGTIDARLMPQLLATYRGLGFRFVTLAEAQRDPTYAEDNDPSLPSRPGGLEERLEARGRTPPNRLDLLAELARTCTR